MFHFLQFSHFHLFFMEKSSKNVIFLSHSLFLFVCFYLKIYLTTDQREKEFCFQFGLLFVGFNKLKGYPVVRKSDLKFFSVLK